MTRRERDTIREQLGEGFHTAFRKASDHPNAHKIWMLIRDLPPAEWKAILDFAMQGVPKVNE